MLAADPHALLRRGRAGVVALLAAEKDVLELVHAGVGEEQRRVVAGEQGTARHDAVAVLLEVLQEGRANFTGMHLSIVIALPGRHHLSGGRFLLARRSAQREGGSGGTSGRDYERRRLRMASMAKPCAARPRTMRARAFSSRSPAPCRAAGARRRDRAGRLRRPPRTLRSTADSAIDPSMPICRSFCSTRGAAAMADRAFHAGGGQRHAAVVERAVVAELLDGGVNLVRVELPPGQPGAQLRLRQLSRRQERQRGRVGVRHYFPKRVISGAGLSGAAPALAAPGAPGRVGAAGFSLLGPPKMAPAIWSREVSAVVEMPCTFSLNSSTFDAQRSASS